jgi:hypothetical protein
MSNFGSVMLIELVLVFGGVLLFAWLQMKDLKEERQNNRNKPKTESI